MKLLCCVVMRAVVKFVAVQLLLELISRDVARIQASAVAFAASSLVTWPL